MNINRWMIISISVFIPLIITVLFVFHGKYETENQNRKAINMRAFARLYAYIRWYHPSDEAQLIDWNKFAIYGLSQIEQVKTEEELRNSLDSLFSPFTAHFKLSTNEEVNNYISNVTNENNNIDLKPVYWQHIGVELSEFSNRYRSFRVNRKNSTNNLSKINFWKHKIANAYRGKKIRIKLAMLGSSDASNINLFLTSLKQQDFVYLLKRDKLNFVGASSWKEMHKEVRVGINDDAIVWGVYYTGKKKINIDQIDLEYLDNGVWTQIENEGFEDIVSKDQLFDWVCSDNEYKVKLDTQIAYSGKKSLQIYYDGKLFEEKPSDKNVEVALTKSLKAHFPLVLMGDSLSTYPKLDLKKINELKVKYNRFKPNEYQMGLADLVVCWSTLAMFSPYTEIAKENWDLNWDEAIINSLIHIDENSTKEEMKLSLEYMTAKLRDAHLNFHKSFEKFGLPFRVKRIDKKIVVVNSDDANIRVGDVLTKLNGMDASTLYQQMEERFSASDALRNIYASYCFYRKCEKNTITVDLIREDSTLVFETVLTRNIVPLNKKQNKELFENCDSITYLHLGKSSINDVFAKLKNSKKGQYVIYDLRDGCKFLSKNLIPDSIYYNSKYPGGQLFPKSCYPQQLFYDEANTIEEISITDKNFKNIFLTSPLNLSNQECFINYIKATGYGITIGENTAGCSGNFNVMKLPSGLIVPFTGAKFVYYDGVNRYGKGIAPDFIVEESISGVKNKTDEAINKALEIIDNGGCQKSKKE